MNNKGKMYGIIIGALVILWGVGIGGGWASAEEKFPSRPVTSIISWSAGGGQDLTARALQPFLEKALGQPVIIINKAGGGGSIGFNEISRAAPDGYTIGQGSPSLLTLNFVMKTDVDYRQFEPIIYGGYSPAAVLVKKESHWKDLKEILDYARANPGKLRVGNTGHGSIGHMAAIGMEQAAGVKFIHVPYKGSAPSIPAVLGGHVDAIVSWITDTLHIVKGGKLKVLGVAAPVRSKFVPEAQTFKELGFNTETVTFYSWVGPKGIPKERVNILYEALKKSIETKEFRDFCDSQGVTVDIRDPKGLLALFERDDKMWKQLSDLAGIKPE